MLDVNSGKKQWVKPIQWHPVLSNKKESWSTLTGLAKRKDICTNAGGLPD